MDNTMRGYKDKIDDVNDFVEDMSGLGIYEFIDDLYNNEIRDKIYVKCLKKTPSESLV